MTQSFRVLPSQEIYELLTDSQAEAARLRRLPETRAGVHAFHAKRLVIDVPYDPDMDTAMREA